MKDYPKILIIEGLDGSGKSTASDFLVSEYNYFRICNNGHHSRRKDCIPWWDDQDTLPGRMKYYLNKNKTDLFCANNQEGKKFLIEKSFITTLAAHTFFMKNVFSTLELSLLPMSAWGATLLLIETDHESRVIRLKQREKRTAFDEITMQDEYEEHFHLITNELLKRNIFKDNVIIYNNNNVEKLNEDIRKKFEIV